MGVEFELKYRATPDILRQIDGFAEGETVRYAMQTTYFDTPSGAEDQISVSINILAQCVVSGMQTMNLIEDAYTVGGTLKPQWKE